eukprot:TRINITY_DN1083_c0_g1_i3.p1 TRINITY_DN1083_c0_g1~~TRINITY_DN1083_c0_g1_i3.p1  ORF type:complete len:206 (+),score=8.13 TRINITY_DN1083_c0_g1_i3:70-687(+)
MLNVPNLDPTAQKNRAFLLACSGGHVHILKRLLQIPGLDGSHPEYLLRAAQCYHYPAIDLLLQVPNCDATWAIQSTEHYWNNPYITSVECLLSNPAAAAHFGVDPNHAIGRHLAAVRFCLPHAKPVTYRLLREAAHEAYEVVLAGVFPDFVNNMVCAAMLSPGLGEWSANEQRRFRGLLDALRAVAPPDRERKERVEEDGESEWQ